MEEESGREAGETGAYDGDLDGTLERLTWWRLLSHCVFVMMTLHFWMKGVDILPLRKMATVGLFPLSGV